MKDGDGGKALELVDKPGSTVVNYRGDDGNCRLHIVDRATATRTGSAYLLSQGADPNVGDTNGDTPLIMAARLGFAEGAARMLSTRALVDKANKLGETALIVAVQQRQQRLVKLLLEAGANPDKTDHASGYSRARLCQARHSLAGDAEADRDGEGQEEDRPSGPIK